MIAAVLPIPAIRPRHFHYPGKRGPMLTLLLIFTGVVLGAIGAVLPSARITAFGLVALGVASLWPYLD